MLKIFKYGSVTLISYLALIAGTYLAVDTFGFEATNAYPIVLTLVYVGVYLASSYFVFEAKNHKSQSAKYVIAVIIFWLLNVAIYDTLVDRLQLQYLLSVIVNILIFGPLRYFIYNKFVFINEEDNTED